MSPVFLLILALVVLATLIQRSGGLLCIGGLAIIVAMMAGIDSQVAPAASLLDHPF